MPIFNRARAARREHLVDAVHRNQALSREGALERLFTFAFSHLVYPQIWEDPVVDMEALGIRPDDHIVAIASGGCNVMSYLTANPAKITAVDLNASHVALNKLKLAAVQNLPEYNKFRDIFAQADLSSNVATYESWIAPKLDAASRAYWEGRDMFGRKRIKRFAKGFYTYGLLGNFIGLAHLLARLHGCNPRALLKAQNIEEQKRIYHEKFEPVFESVLIKWLVGKPASLYGLGIPPAQYRALAGDHPDGMKGALRVRLEKLACGFPLRENYFAWQAFGRAYEPGENASLPPYLHQQHFQKLKESASRVAVLQDSMTKFLADSPASSVDCFVLLDAQDWMNDHDLNALWAQITRTARPGARVIFRTAADEQLLPGRVAGEILADWRREDNLSARLHAMDRSAIYGAFHLYKLQERQG